MPQRYIPDNAAAGAGTVTSVGLSMPAELTVSGSPVTGAGVLGVVWASETTNFIFAGPGSGGAGIPSFRAMVNADLPASGVTPTTYGDSTHVAQFAVNSKGIITGAANVPIVGGGGVSSVGLALPAEFSVSGSPVTGSGTLTGVWVTESANFVFAGPVSGGAAVPAFRALVVADLPSGGVGLGDMVRLAQVVTAGSQTTAAFSSIPGGYSALRITYQSRDTAAGTGTTTVFVKMNGDAVAANYDTEQAIVGSGATAAAGFAAPSVNGTGVYTHPNNGATAGYTGIGEVLIPNYTGNVFFKQFVTTNYEVNNTTPVRQILLCGATWKSTVAINAITFTAGTAFVDGSTFTLYGIR